MPATDLDPQPQPGQSLCVQAAQNPTRALVRERFERAETATLVPDPRPRLRLCDVGGGGKPSPDGLLWRRIHHRGMGLLWNVIWWLSGAGKPPLVSHFLKAIQDERSTGTLMGVLVFLCSFGKVLVLLRCSIGLRFRRDLSHRLQAILNFVASRAYLDRYNPGGLQLT